MYILLLQGFCHVNIFTYFSEVKKINTRVKIQKYSNTVSPLAGISFVNYYFNKVGFSQLIDNELGNRVKRAGFSYSDMIKNLTNVFLSGGDVIEDISTHLGSHLKEYLIIMYQVQIRY